MSQDIDWDRVNALVDPAEAAMETLSDEEGFPAEAQPERREYGVYLGWTGNDGIGRNVEASVHPGTYELEVVYNAWSDHGIEGHKDTVRLWTREVVGRFPHPTDAIPDAVRTAYDEVIDVEDADLNRTDRIRRREG